MAFYIKICYRGKLKNPSDVHQLIAETEDICKSNGWSYRVWEESWDEPQTLGMNTSSNSDTGEGLRMSFEGHAPLKGI